jgi:probable selenium-dependent hydroxylase accessory protein YqeC
VKSLRQALMLEDDGVISLVGSGGKTTLMFQLAHELASAGESVLTTTTTKIFEPSAKQTPHVMLADCAEKLLPAAEKLMRRHRHFTAAAGRLSAVGKLAGFQPQVIEKIWHAGLFRWIIIEADGAAGRPLKAPADHEPVIAACTRQVVGVVGLNVVGKSLEERWVFRPTLFSRITGRKAGSRITPEAVADVLVHERGIFKGAAAGMTRVVFLNQADVAHNLDAGRQIVHQLAERISGAIKRTVIGQVRHQPPVLEVYDF